MDGRVVNVQELQLEEEEGAVCRVGDAPRVLAVIAVAQICTAASQCMSCSWVWALYSLPPTFPPSPVPPHPAPTASLTYCLTSLRTTSQRSGVTHSPSDSPSCGRVCAYACVCVCVWGGGGGHNHKLAEPNNCSCKVHFCKRCTSQRELYLDRAADMGEDGAEG